jgi:hypothetical protein
VNSSAQNRQRSRWVGVFLWFGALMAFLAGITLVWHGTKLDKIWTLNPRAYNALSPFGTTAGVLFLALAAALAIAATGWLMRRRWGWWLAVIIIGTQVLGNVTNILYGHIVEGGVGVAIAGSLVFYMTRPFVRVHFAVKPK